MNEQIPTRGSAFQAAMLLLIAGIGADLSGPARGSTREVGPGKQFPRIEDASARARPAGEPRRADGQRRGQGPQLPGEQEAAKEPPLAWQYRHPAGREKRPPEDPLTLGAYASPPPKAGGQ